MVASVEFRIVGLFVREHFEHDFKQTLAQTSQGTGVAHALVALFLVISLAPRAGFAKAIGPEVNGVPKEFVAGPANVCFVDLARLVAHGRSPGEALEHVVSAVTLRIGADGGQE